jgi:hypothetical protein
VRLGLPQGFLAEAMKRQPLPLDRWRRLPIGLEAIQSDAIGLEAIQSEAILGEAIEFAPIDVQPIMGYPIHGGRCMRGNRTPQDQATTYCNHISFDSSPAETSQASCGPSCLRLHDVPLWESIPVCL